MNVKQCDNCGIYGSVNEQRWVHVEFTGRVLSWSDPSEGWDLCSYTCVQEWAEQRKKID